MKLFDKIKSSPFSSKMKEAAADPAKETPDNPSPDASAPPPEPPSLPPLQLGNVG
jgi:hypothetical protein